MPCSALNHPGESVSQSVSDEPRYRAVFTAKKGIGVMAVPSPVNQGSPGQMVTFWDGAEKLLARVPRPVALAMSEERGGISR